MSNFGSPIARFEAIKAGYAQKKGGKYLTLLLSGNPDDDCQKLLDLELGEVVQVFVTVKEIGA